VFELKQSFSAEPVADCPECGSRSRRKFHAVPVIYKGSGFYTTDYARSSLRANGTGASSSDSSEKKEKSASKAKKKDSSKSSSSEGKKDSGSAVSSSSRSRD
jgi:predicted nucleic acid-binding Zn ribbon protein